MTREDGTHWAWGYNDRGEVTSGGKKFSDGTPQPVLQFGYAYDAIGNRTSSKGGTDQGHTIAYTPNGLNQYSSRTVPPYLAVTGEAAADASVAVQAKKPHWIPGWLAGAVAGRSGSSRLGMSHDAAGFLESDSEATCQPARLACETFHKSPLPRRACIPS